MRTSDFCDRATTLCRSVMLCPSRLAYASLYFCACCQPIHHLILPHSLSFLPIYQLFARIPFISDHLSTATVLASALISAPIARTYNSLTRALLAPMMLNVLPIHSRQSSAGNEYFPLERSRAETRHLMSLQIPCLIQSILCIFPSSFPFTNTNFDTHNVRIPSRHNFSLSIATCTPVYIVIYASILNDPYSQPPFTHL